MLNVIKKIPVSLVLIIIPILYLVTLGQSLVLGDPSEYTFVANVLGIAHPPGYTFITLLGKLFQTLIPFGEIPWRMHLLSAAAATAAALFVYGTVHTLAQSAVPTLNKLWAEFAAVFGALVVATAVNFWQHAIHANPHIITAAFLAANLFFLTRWWANQKLADQNRIVDGQTASHKWLFVFCFSAGLGVTHHPLTVFSFVAYGLFVVLVRPSILKEWRTIIKMFVFALLGLSLWLYLPIRSSMQPIVGPHTLNTLNGFLDHVLGRGITEALPYYSLVEQPARTLVFWSILRLQYSLVVIFLALLGTLWPLLERFIKRRSGKAPSQISPTLPILLYILAFISNYAFVISLKAQDIMAYALGLQLIIGLLAGVGFFVLLFYIQVRLQMKTVALGLLIGALFLLGPIAQIVTNVAPVSLRDYDEGDAYVEAVFTEFEGQGEGAVLLNDWEHMTPLWYTQFVEERWPDPADIRPEYVSTARTWLENVFDFLPGGPVYLSNYRREIVEAGFRLRPFGPFYQVVEPGDTTLPAELIPVTAQGDEVELVGYLLPKTAVSAGDYISLILAMQSPAGTNDYYVPVISIGDLSFPFTTDSHLTTPNWQPGEIIVERFDFALPHTLPTGDYPITVSLKNLSTDNDSGIERALGTLTVTGQEHPITTKHLLANFRQRLGLVAATASSNGQHVTAPWQEPIQVQPGDIINLNLRWQSLAKAEESYTVFVHLIDLANQPIVALDYTPLGGAMPTHLWIPKWLPGQQATDPYRMQIPPDLPPGTYLIEVGLYDMVGGRRLHIADEAGNLVGDRQILGSVLVE